MSISTSLLDAYWGFNAAATQYLEKLYTSQDADIFNPASHGNDFTVCGYINPDLVTNSRGIIGRWNTTSDNRCWLIRQNGTDLEVWISNDGTVDTNHYKFVKLIGCLTASTPYFFCARYEYNGNGALATKLYLKCNGTASLAVLCPGPIYTGGTANLQIANYVDSGNNLFDGRIYYLAYFNKFLSDSEVDTIYNNTVLPQQLKPNFLLDFHNTVASTIDSSIPPNELSNRAITLDVNGTPTRLGTTTSSADTIQGFGEVASAQELVTILNLQQAFDKQNGAHPLISTKLQGLAMLLRIKSRMN